MRTKKAKTPPIYRAIERLLSWAVPMVDSLPKSLACQTLGGLLIRDLRDCLNAVLLGQDTGDVPAKVQCIKVLLTNLTGIRTTMRVFTGNRYVSVKQEMEFLDLVNPIQIQAAAWLRKWEPAVDDEG